MPTLRQLEYLVALADMKHFGRAAAASHAAQPTLSHQIRALEARLGTTLVERSAGGAELTPVGREVAARARKVLMEIRDIRDLTRRAGTELAGTLRLGVSPTIGPYLLPPILAELHREHAGLSFYIREGFPDEQVLDLSRGGLDLLLGPLPMAGADLQVEPLFREPLHLVCAPDHPLAGRGRPTPADLRGADILSLDRRHPLHRQVAAICAALGANLLGDYEGTSLDSLRQMVASGLGLALLPELYIRSEAGGTVGLMVLRIDGWSATRSIGLAWRRGAALQEQYRMIAAHIAGAAATALQAEGAGAAASPRKTGASSPPRPAARGPSKARRARSARPG